MKHKEYNLNFVNEIVNNRVFKSCYLINSQSNPSFIVLSTYLLYLQWADDIINSILPEIDLALENKDFEDISVEGINISLDKLNTHLEWNGWHEDISTQDFKTILEEYSEFLQTSPINGTRI